MTNRVLVVTTADVPTEAMNSLVRAHAGADAEIHVVAPASKVSWLDHLTNAEDDAHAEASDRAVATAATVSGDNTVTAHAGDADPIQAIADALRQFPADEVVLVTAPEESATWLEGELGERARKTFDVPITHLTTA